MTKLYITMPQPGETITEGLIVRWLAEPGDELQEGSPLVELETEKALFEYESPFAGVLVEILHPINARVKVGLPIAVIDVPTAKEKHYAMLGLAQKVEESEKTAAASDSRRGSSRKAAPIEPHPAAPSVTTPPRPIKTSPYVRKMVREKGITTGDLIQMAAQNPQGRITVAALSHVPPHTGAPSSTHQISPASGTTFSAIPCSPIRMRIAENMILSKSKIPHAHTGLAVDVSRVLKYRDSIKDDFKTRTRDNLSFLSLVYPALINAIRKRPVVNSSYIDSTSPHEIRVFNKINLGVAVGTEHGLFIPVLHNIEAMQREEFNHTLNDLIRRAHEKKLRVEELTGATLIFNNFGFFGTSIGVQVISYPLAATLGMGVIEKRVVPSGDGITVHEMADFVIAFDHRVMDGRDAGLFLSELKQGIEGLY